MIGSVNTINPIFCVIYIWEKQFESFDSRNNKVRNKLKRLTEILAFIVKTVFVIFLTAVFAFKFPFLHPNFKGW